MGSSRKPGPIGISGQPEDLNDGTMIRALSPRPTPTGIDPASTGGRHRSTSLTTVPSKPVRRRTAASTLHVLRQGSRGSEVRKLQQQLNARLTPSPELAVDGIFGPLTRQAILHYQQGVHIPADGVADKQTWYHLLKGDEATILRLASAGPPPALASPRASGSTAPAAPPRTPSENIWEWPLQRKMLAVLQRVPSRLPRKARDEFEALLQIENLALSLAIIAGFCLLGGGSALVFGVVILGLEMTTSLASTLQRAALAATEDELNDAADELAYIVLAIGVAALIKGVSRIAKGVKDEGKGGTTKATSRLSQERVPSTRSSTQSAAADEPQSPRHPLPAQSVTKLTKEDLSAWYRQQGDYFNDAKNLENHLEGTDFTKPVIKTVLPENTELIQYVRQDGKPGIYFARPGTPMEKLGIKEPPPRSVKKFMVKKPIEIIESTAATLEVELAPGIGGCGGGQQIILPKGWEGFVESVIGGQ